jgi:N-acetylmuramoyl-L-alanine amidase
MFLVVKKWNALYLMCLLSLFVGFALVVRQGEAVAVSQVVESVQPVLIIDPGHGGEDGGAVAEDGTVESGVNLSIALKLEELARLTGYDTTMTRREDVSIHDSDASTLRQKKVSDLHNRVDLCNQVEGGVLVSIHQNSLPSSKKTQGAQVFYNGVDGSEALAQAIQESLNASVNGDHPKTAKRIDSSVYLMENTTCPAVLVECGFLSNAQETELLKDQDYQRRLAAAILAGVEAGLGAEAAPTLE